jgi:hypothetical protein
LGNEETVEEFLNFPLLRHLVVLSKIFKGLPQERDILFKGEVPGLSVEPKSLEGSFSFGHERLEDIWT